MRTLATDAQNTGTVTGALKPVRGFTLLELLVVLSIIGIAATLVAPTITSTESKTFNAQIRQAEAALNYARRIAIVRSTPSVARFRVLDPDDPFREEAPTDARGLRIPYWESNEVGIRFRNTFEQDAEETDTVEITFFPQGGSTGGVLNFRMNQLTAYIDINPITGRISTSYEDPGL